MSDRDLEPHCKKASLLAGTAGVCTLLAKIKVLPLIFECVTPFFQSASFSVKWILIVRETVVASEKFNGNLLKMAS